MHLSSTSLDTTSSQALQAEAAASATGATAASGSAGATADGDAFSLRLAQALGQPPQGQNIATAAASLTSVALSPTLELVTAGAGQPDGESLAAFATAQGIAPEVVAWLFSEGGQAEDEGKPGEASKDEGTLDAALQASTLLPPGLMIPVQSPHLTGLGHGGVSPGSQGINPGQTLGLAPAAAWMGQWVSGLAADFGSAPTAPSAQLNVPDAAGSFAAAQALASAGLFAKAEGKPGADTGKLETALKGASTPVEILSLEVDPFVLALLEDGAGGGEQAPDLVPGNPVSLAPGASSGGAGALALADGAGETPQASSAQHRAEALHALAQRLGEAVGQRVLGQIASGTWSMKLLLKPSTLGEVEVDLRMRAGELDAAFRAFNPMTRELLADGLPRLREVLSGAGMDIAALHVGQGSSQSAGGNPTPQQSLPGGRREEAGSKPLSGTDALASPAATSVRRASSANWDVLV
ncbi:MAG: flagellar hook-length control protein FliK [Ramlibacter sp.]|uniref:flagellar hook-length control protein FliK n=1 Tax=Ramlibacter sp. TaxID=1917967 RepID=UPI00260C01BC|nr:flagellar hook-length control protein FliK [Ramlibacter sp.]MDH4376792.1 flagellar hook-length control protein FliK [Ramlibacter sp.]